MLKPGDRVGVAVSGGADSVCLLHVLQRLAAGLRVSLTVVHLNHQLRGAESDADEVFVRELAVSLGLPSLIDSAPVAQRGGNLEQSGRRARQEFFARLIDRGCLEKIATAHTRSDQAETVLYRLIRGSGTAGLAGIRPVTAHGVIRPMLDVDRSDVLAYLGAHGLSWREDTSNEDPRFVRNRMRHHLLPLLARDYNPRIVSTLAQVADIARDEESWWARQIAASPLTRPRLPIPDLMAVHPAVRRRVVREILQQVRGDLRGISAAHIEAILALAAAPAGSGRVALPRGTEVIRSFDVLLFRQQTVPVEEYQFAAEAPVHVRLPGTSRRLSLQIIEIPSTSGSAGDDNVYNGGGDCLDADRLPRPLVIRNWRPGDVLRRRGRSERKLKLLFQKARVPLWSRRGWPVLAGGATIVWSRGFGVAAGFEPSAATRRILVVCEGESDPPFESNEGCCASLT